MSIEQELAVLEARAQEDYLDLDDIARLLAEVRLLQRELSCLGTCIYVPVYFGELCHGAGCLRRPDRKLGEP